MKSVYRALANYFDRKANDGYGPKRSNRLKDSVSIEEYMPTTPEGRQSYNIRVYPANGGYIVEVRFYGNRSNSNHSQVYEDVSNLYIIQDGEDLVEGIGKAMMLDKLSGGN